MGNFTTDFSETLRMAAADTLENLAFTEIEPETHSTLANPADTYLGTRISLGTMGQLDLVMDKDLLEEVAITLFSPKEGSVSQEMRVDTLHEIVNIIAGRFLEAVFKGKSDFALGLPEIHLDISEWNALPLRWILCADGAKQLAVAIGPESHAE